MIINETIPGSFLVISGGLSMDCPVGKSGDCPAGKSGGQFVRPENDRNCDRTMTGQKPSISPEKFGFWQHRCPVLSGRKRWRSVKTSRFLWYFAKIRA
jgi:hypothetical protein